MLSAGDVATAFRNIGIHSESVHLFAGHIQEEHAIVIDMYAAFGWTGSPGAYGVAGDAVAYIHGHTVNDWNPYGFFDYHWVDDHVLIAAALGSNCKETERSLRAAILAVLGPAAINEEKFTKWNPKQKILGLIFDSTANTVSVPQDKIEKALALVVQAYHSPELSRKSYRSLLGCLRHVATCFRPARAFLQRLRRREPFLHRWQTVNMSDAMRQDLIWWYYILNNHALNGISLEYFNTLPPPDISIEVDASDTGLCAIDTLQKRTLVYKFNSEERHLIAATKATPNVGFDINYRELLSCAFAVFQWGTSWAAAFPATNRSIPLHIHFKIDNTSAISWQSKLSSPNPRAQTIIRLLSIWETTMGLRISSSHIAGEDNVIADAGSRSSNDAQLAELFTNKTRDWLQVSPAISVKDLEKHWQRICELTPLRTPRSTST